MLVLDQIASHPTKVDRTEEVLEIYVEDPTFPPVPRGIGNDGAVPFESMRDPILPLVADA